MTRLSHGKAVACCFTSKNSFQDSGRVARSSGSSGFRHLSTPLSSLIRNEGYGDLVSQGEKTEDAKAPLIVIEPETAFWLQGLILGLTQSSVICVLSLECPADLEIDSIKAAMTQLVPHARLTPPDPSASLEEKLLQCVHAWQAAIQRDRSLPVFGPCSISRMNRRAEGATKASFRFAIPSAHLEATRITLAWTIMAINRLAAGVDDLDGMLGDLSNSLAKLQNGLMPFAMRGTNNFRFMEAAAVLGIPYHTLIKDMVIYGQGSNSIQLLSTVSDKTKWMGDYALDDTTRCAYHGTCLAKT